MFGLSQETLMSFFPRAVMLFAAFPVHECAHGLVAARLGDDTPEKQGRLTLNPFAHLDPIGSVMLLFLGFGWGKSVEIDMRNFKHPRRDMALSALAGPASNIVMAFVFLAVEKIIFGFWPGRSWNALADTIDTFLSAIIFINIILAVFNLLPIPPLDGSKIMGLLLPEKLYWGMLRYQRQISLIVILLLVFTKVLSGPLTWLAIRVYSVLDFLTRPIDLLLYR